ncbi:hypothetical protein SERLADRAFT_367015 [Serpula lacrymans var. lacrymans S7.9]|uniref:Major facilitator superfamily (MFS) profile domain-containing protein n=1 Tax=Serpula lacrymans var. lacrymans (strain S7.9) TaxID=578457 RepID=F8NMR8_SERL9|nr:uncharacterized protein SERLADRAFT_367015 [Serpula lacrymans var. lacrymans S7.9]EGO27465.1 hypothetical protein SERLADRAFT_367015 [Serpula lacrymans var. lacrymans S7.9]
MAPSKESQPLLTHHHPEYTPPPGPSSPDVLQQQNHTPKADLFWILTGLWSAVFLGTIVATLLSPIGSYFNKSNQSSYIATSYLLSVCCFTPLYGRLSDIIGRRGAMLLALSLFGSGTIACGLASSMEILIIARAVAGMGGGGKQRGLYQGMTNILFGLGAGLGGPLGGWMNDTFGWRAAFLLQVEHRSVYDKLRRIDFAGSLTLVGAVASMLLAFSLKTAEELAWSHPLIWGLFVGSAVCWALFIFVEARWAPYPVMPLRLITCRTPFAVSIVNLLASISAFSMYFSAVRLNSSTNAGMHLLPHSVALSTGSVFAGWLMRRTGKLYMLTLLSTVLTVFAGMLLITWNDQTASWHLWLDVVPQGLGMASLITTTLIAMIASVYKEDMAVATGITYLFRTTGQVLGVSLSGAILQEVLLRKLRERIRGPGSIEIRHSINVIPDLDPSLRKAAVASYADALRVVFICQAAMNVLAFLACIPIEEHPLP